MFGSSDAPDFVGMECQFQLTGIDVDSGIFSKDDVDVRAVFVPQRNVFMRCL